MRSSVTRELEAIRDEMRELKGYVHSWQNRHEKQHKDDQAAVVKGRRFMITTGIACVLMLVAIMALVVQILGQTRGLLPRIPGPARYARFVRPGFDPAKFPVPQCPRGPARSGIARASRTYAPSWLDSVTGELAVPGLNRAVAGRVATWHGAGGSGEDSPEVGIQGGSAPLTSRARARQWDHHRPVSGKL